MYSFRSLCHVRRGGLFNTRDTRVTIPHLKVVHHVATNTGRKTAGRMVRFLRARERYPRVTSVEKTNAAIEDYQYSSTSNIQMYRTPVAPTRGFTNSDINGLEESVQ